MSIPGEWPSSYSWDSQARAVRQLTHDGRSILQKAQAALERLRWRLAEQPEVLGLVDKVEHAHDELLRLCENACDLFLPIPMTCCEHNLVEVWGQVWDGLAAAYPQRSLEATEEFSRLDLQCEVDWSRLSQALRYLLEHFLTVVSGPLRLVVTADHCELAGQPGVQMTLGVPGRELLYDDRRLFFDPFPPTNPRRHGLGPAAACRIVEAHGGRLFLAEGAEFKLILQLPRRPS
jgi:hypothetical protein